MTSGESESASIDVLSAKVRVLRVGNGQLTYSVYRQHDEATLTGSSPLGE
jgi:hypothetical protein